MFRLRLLSALLIFFGGLVVVPAGTVSVPAGISVDHWQALLRKYADARGLVAYGAWKAHAADLRKLDAGGRGASYSPGLFKRLF